jgi:hypothetical protein
MCFDSAQHDFGVTLSGVEGQLTTDNLSADRQADNRQRFLTSNYLVHLPRQTFHHPLEFQV